MTTTQVNEVIQHLRSAVLLRDGADSTDAQLLEAYLRRRDESALAALVCRHAPMVWGVCRRVLGNYHDTEDAFQATFLVLVRKAAAIASRELLANWLFGVAHQTALKAKAMAARRAVRERQVAHMPEPAVEPAPPDDLARVLDDELGRLPAKYRAVLVLCELDGRTRKEAARELDCPEGTVAGRLARARTMLARRLAQRGVVLSGGIVTALTAQGAASACVPAALVAATIKAAVLVAAGQAAAATPSVAALTEGVLKTMLVTKYRTALLMVLGAVLLGLTASGGWMFAQAQAAAQGPEEQVPPAPPQAAPAKTTEAPREDKDKDKPQPPVVAVDAKQLIWVYHTNEALADEHFTGKPVKLTGSVIRVKRAAEAKVAYVLVLEPLTPEYKTRILVHFAAEARQQLSKVRPFQRVTVEARCTGRDTPEDGYGTIICHSGKLLHVGPAPSGVGGGPGPGGPAR
jgi:RNA polymerase sigma factor (sigma-70 family)